MESLKKMKTSLEYIRITYVSIKGTNALSYSKCLKASESYCLKDKKYNAKARAYFERRGIIMAPLKNVELFTDIFDKNPSQEGI